MKQKLHKPKQLEGTGWYIRANLYNYLRPDGTVREETGYDSGINVGYWKTEKEAMRAYNSYMNPKLISKRRRRV